jgi:hypothetical protein
MIRKNEVFLSSWYISLGIFNANLKKIVKLLLEKY